MVPVDKLLANRKAPLSYVQIRRTLWESPLCGCYEQLYHLDDLLLRRTRLGLILLKRQ